MSIGRMRHKLHIQEQERSSDGGGSQSVTERVFGDQLEEKVTHIITTRFSRKITFKNRIEYRFNRDGENFSRIFNIKRVINKNTRDRYLEILCEEGVAT